MSVVAPCVPLVRTQSRLEAAARLLHPGGSGGFGVVAPDVLDALAAGLAEGVDPDHFAVEAGSGQARRHRQLVRTSTYDAWLIAWGPSSVLDLHDHGGSTGAFRVILGELIETYSDKVDRHPLRAVNVPAGGRRAVPAARVHEVWNPGAGQALSVHVYSPPLTAMTFFDHHPERFLSPLRTEYGDAATLD
jgi:hypothetical protein